MDNTSDNATSSNEDLGTVFQENHSLLIKPIEKDIIHRICSGQVSKLLFLLVPQFILTLFRLF